jgi:hypothetical protein
MNGDSGDKRGQDNCLATLCVSRDDRDNTRRVSLVPRGFVPDSGWRPISRPPRRLWIACSSCLNATVNEEKALRGWQENSRYATPLSLHRVRNYSNGNGHHGHHNGRGSVTTRRGSVTTRAKSRLIRYITLSRRSLHARRAAWMVPESGESEGSPKAQRD